MSRLKERDEQEALKLDEYFKETVERVRPYILALDVPEDRQLCRVWLQKLSCASSQRSLRNQYLLELCKHLRSGNIGEIFGKPPQNGPLGPLSRFCDHTLNASSSLSELSDTSCLVSHDHPRSIAKRRSKIFSENRSTDSSSTNCDEEIAENSAIRCPERIVRTDRNQLNVYKRRVESLTSVVRDLQFEKERLKRNFSYNKDNCECKEKSKSLNSTIEQLTLEIATLRTRFVEVNSMKDELEKNHREIVEQYKDTMRREFDNLNLRLREAQSKNEELDDKVASVDDQLEKILRETREELIAIEQNFETKIQSAQFYCETELAERDRELLLKEEIINEKDAELSTREKFYADEIVMLNEKIRILEEKLEMKLEDEGRLRSFLKEQCGTMKEEFMKMRNDMEASTRNENQTLVDKISSLKKIIQKLMKLKEKQGIEFENKISHLLKTKDLEIKSLELRLQEQHTELSTTLSTEKQCELDSLVRLLEERYKGLLAATDASVGIQRQNFLKKITCLESQVTCMKNSLVDNDLYV